jgi:hypothetical protein
MVIGAFTIFAAVLAWAERTWRPAPSQQSTARPPALPRAAE